MYLENINIYKTSKSPLPIIASGEFSVIDGNPRNGRIKVVHDDTIYWLEEKSLEKQPEKQLEKKELIEYVVKRGENSYSLALRYGVPVDRLVEKYGLQPAIGTKIIIEK